MYCCIAVHADVPPGNIKFPTDDADLAQLARGFAAISPAIPNVVAAVDSVIFERTAPTATKFEDANQTSIGSHFCRKGYFGVTVLAFVDAQMRFLSISISCGSSSHDGTLFSCSKVGAALDEGAGIKPHWIVVGDDAFKSKGHVITPFSGKALSTRQSAFNYYVSVLRQVVERAFHLWKAKWGIFWRPLSLHNVHIKCVVECTARLHNFCIDRNVSANPNDFVVYDDVFWQRTYSRAISQKRRRTRCAAAPYADVIFADAATIAAMLGHLPTDRAKRVLRTCILEHLDAQGFARPVIVHAPKRKPAARRCAIVHCAAPFLRHDACIA